MRILPGKPDYINTTAEQISSRSLIQHMVNVPDILPRVFGAYKQKSPLTAFLDMKGLKTKNLLENTSTGSFKTVGSNHVMYRIQNKDLRKVRFKSVTFPGGGGTGTYYSPAYGTATPGKYQTEVYIGLDSNIPGPKTVIELDDNRTQLYMIEDTLPLETADGYIYKAKIVTKHKESFIDPECMIEGAEAAVVMDIYEQDFSETGPEIVMSFDGWGHAYLTLQRVKLSWSGTAEAMKSNGDVWFESNGQATFLSKANSLMMEQAAQFHEYQIIFGKSTVSEVDGSVLLRDSKGREQLAGDGIMNQNDGSYEYPYNNLSMSLIEGIMSDLEIREDREGLMEVIVLMSRKYMMKFSTLLKNEGYVTQNNNVEGSGSKKGVNNNYEYYEFGGVRLIPMHFPWLDASTTGRPTKYNNLGEALSETEMFFIPTGKTAAGDDGVQLVQLRPPVAGTINGINKGEMASNSVDGSHKHFLFQTGVICRIKTARAFKQYPYQKTHVSFA